jgi:AAA+ ATPase superfamily predicted ATPase
MDLAICKKQSIYYDEVPCRGELLSIPRIVQHICSWIKNTFKQCKYVFDSDKSTLYIENQCVIDIVAKALKSVHFIEYLDNEEYDVLLCNNVVFIDLIDAAACNVVNECILRNTPILINRFKATEEMLGSKYPLFFESLDDIPKLLTSLNIYSATVYLQKMDKMQYSIQSFVNNFTKHVDFY